jgi:hypothetical protein
MGVHARGVLQIHARMRASLCRAEPCALENDLVTRAEHCGVCLGGFTPPTAPYAAAGVALPNIDSDSLAIRLYLPCTSALCMVFPSHLHPGTWLRAYVHERQIEVRLWRSTPPAGPCMLSAAPSCCAAAIPTTRSSTLLLARCRCLLVPAVYLLRV